MAVKWLNCESFIHVGIVSSVCRVWHPCFPLNGIKKYLTVPSSSGIRIDNSVNCTMQKVPGFIEHFAHGG